MTYTAETAFHDDIAVQTIDRLRSYSDGFDQTVLERVGESATIAYTVGSVATALYEAVHMERPKMIEYGGCPPLQILDLPAKHESPVRAATVVCLPMARGLDAAELHRAARKKLLLPEDERLVVVGSPTGWRSPSGRLTDDQRRQIHDGDPTQLLSSLFYYLREQGIQRVNWVGNSFGAHEALAAAAFAVEHGIHAVSNVVLIESPDGSPQGFWELAWKFLSTKDGVPEVKQRLIDVPFARALDEQPKLLPYIFNLACGVNRTIAHSIARGKFEEHMQALLKRSPLTSVLVAWGTASEIVQNEQMTQELERLENEYPGRIERLVLKGLKHAMYIDIDLVNAVIMQGLRKSVSTGDSPISSHNVHDAIGYKEAI